MNNFITYNRLRENISSLLDYCNIHGQYNYPDTFELNDYFVSFVENYNRDLTMYYTNKFARNWLYFLLRLANKYGNPDKANGDDDRLY